MMTFLIENVDSRETAARLMEEVDSVPNGNYVVWGYDRNVHLQVHTVISGPLRGFRVLKRRDEATRRYRGFAFITSDDRRVSLWRRFAHEAESDHVSAAQFLLASLGGERATSGPWQRFEVSERRCGACNVAIPVDYTLCAPHRTVMRAAAWGQQSSSPATPADPPATPEPASTVLLCENGSGEVR